MTQAKAQFEHIIIQAVVFRYTYPPVYGSLRVPALNGHRRSLQPP